MENNNFLGTEKVGKLLAKFAIPCILSLLISALYNIVDQIFIGNSNVGAIGNTATTIVFPLTCIALAFALMLGDGTASFMSLESGKGEGSKIHKAVGSAIVVGLIISILFVAICAPTLSNILYFFGARTDKALSYSIEYGTIILIGVPFYILMNLFNSVIRADGSPKIAMISMVSGALINIILDAVFINGFGMGLTGAALATIIGQIASFIISLIYLIRPKTFKLKLESFKVNLTFLGHILKLGFSSFLTQFSIVIVSIVSMNMLAIYGSQSKYGSDDPQAIMGIVMKIFTIVVNIAVGIAAGAQPIIGYNYGAKKFDRVKKLLILILGLNLILGIISTLLFELIPGQIISLFGSNSENPDLYYEFGILTLRLYLAFIIFTLIQKVTAIYLQATGSPIKATVLSLLRDVIIIIPAMIILPKFLGITGVLYSSWVSDCISIIITVIFLVIEFKKLTNMQKNA